MLRSLNGRNLLFSEPSQAVYELDDLAAFLWRELDRGLTAEDILRDVRASGASAAEGQIADVVEQLRAIRSSAATPAQSRAIAEPLASIVLELAGVAIQLHLPFELLREVDAVFGDLRSGADPTHAQICLRLTGGQVELLHPGRPGWSCAREEFLPLLKGELIEAVLQWAAYEVALHAAALVHGGRLLLLAGSPGAGKTTLALAATHAGFELAADDVVLVHDDGSATGLPLPSGTKPGSWALIPNIPEGPTHRRPDGQIVRYVRAEPMAEPRPRRIGYVVLLDRRAQGPAEVQDVDATDALAALIAEGASRDERLSTAGFAALTGVLGEARCCRLAYSDLAEAIAALRELGS